VLKSIDGDFDETKLDLKGEKRELFCLDIMDGRCTPSGFDCFVGTTDGRMCYLAKGWLSNTLELIHNVPDEGPVTQVIFKHGLIAWSTPKKIRVTHFKKNRQKICMIEKPDCNLAFARDLAVQSQAIPSIQIMAQMPAGNAQYPNVFVYISWFHTLKKVKVEMDEKSGKFVATTIYTHDMGKIYLSGLNVAMLQNCFVTCEFDHSNDTDKNFRETTAFPNLCI